MSTPQMQNETEMREQMALSIRVGREEARMLKEERHQAEARGEILNPLLGVTMFSHYARFKKVSDELIVQTSGFAKRISALPNDPSNEELALIHSESEKLHAKYEESDQFVENVRDVERNRARRMAELNARVAPIKVKEVKDERAKAVEIFTLSRDLDRYHQIFKDARQKLARLETVFAK